MPLDDWLEFLKKRAQRKFNARVQDDHVLDAGYRSDPITPNEAYFEIRVSEMFLSYKSEYGRSFVPFTVLASEFVYDGKRRTFPFFVGSKLLQDVESYVEGKDVNFRNTRVVGPVPYGGDDVALFVGLYRIQADDFLRELLNVLGKVVGVYDIGKLSNYVDVAGVLTDGLYSLFNFEQLEYRTGYRDVYQDHGIQLFREGYLAYVNCKENAINSNQLWVEDGALYIGESKDARQPLRDHDYCLVQIQRLEKRNDYTTLAFNEIWKQAHDHVSHGNHGIGHSLFVECCRQIAESPDLTPWHAQHLIEAYTARYTQVVELYDKLHKLMPQRTATVYRDASGRSLPPQQSIQKTAQMALNAGVEENVLQGLTDLSQNWGRIPHLDSPDAELTDDALNEQLTAIEGFSKVSIPNPKALAEALAIAAVTAS
jgi:hypothetical protein